MSAFFEYFNFLRPLWLLAVLPLGVLWYSVRPKLRRNEDGQAGIALHLAAALTVGDRGKRHIYSIDGVAFAGILLSLGAAGPTWSKLENQLIEETAPLVVALRVAPSMETPDLAPTRLERAKFKIMDLIAARAGGNTALVAYAGSAHQVSPLTEDPNILRPLLEGLNPDVMPVAGDNAAAALSMSLEILSTAESPGAVLFALDNLNPADVEALNKALEKEEAPVVFLVTAPRSLSLPQLGQVNGASVVQLSADSSDIDRIERRIRSAHAATLAGDDRLQWNDRGWWLMWPAAILCALWFRRGWTMRWAIVLVSVALVQSPNVARADGWIDWFLTPDQQGRLAFENKRFADAGALFENPVWRGYAKYRAGRYEDAIVIFSKLDSPEAAFVQGLAEIKSRQYRPAVQSFETALTRRPDFPAAMRNREIALAIVDYVETTREQSDTGEDSGIGADDVVFDNETNRGAETQIETTQEAAAPLTAEQWIQSIDTDVGDFLRSRFLLDMQGDN